MLNKLKVLIRNYFHTKKLFTIVTDFLFAILILLLLIPGTRTEVASFFIRMTALPPSALSQSKQYTISNKTRQWVITDMKGHDHVFGQLFDKPVFVNFWATWCPPCNAELPGISDLYKKYKGQVHFVLLSDETPAKIIGFSKKHQYENMPFYRYRFVPNDFSSKSIPTTFILSKKGKVILSKKGAARWQSGKVQKLLDNLLSKQN